LGRSSKNIEKKKDHWGSKNLHEGDPQESDGKKGRFQTVLHLKKGAEFIVAEKKLTERRGKESVKERYRAEGTQRTLRRREKEDLRKMAVQKEKKKKTWPLKGRRGGWKKKERRKCLFIFNDISGKKKELLKRRTG